MVQNKQQTTLQKLNLKLKNHQVKSKKTMNNQKIQINEQIDTKNNEQNFSILFLPHFNISLYFFPFSNHK